MINDKEEHDNNAGNKKEDEMGDTSKKTSAYFGLIPSKKYKNSGSKRDFEMETHQGENFHSLVFPQSLSFDSEPKAIDPSSFKHIQCKPCDGFQA